MEKEEGEEVERMVEAGGQGLVWVRTLAVMAVWAAVVMAFGVVAWVLTGVERELGVKEVVGIWQRHFRLLAMATV